MGSYGSEHGKRKIGIAGLSIILHLVNFCSTWRYPIACKALVHFFFYWVYVYVRKSWSPNK